MQRTLWEPAIEALSRDELRQLQWQKLQKQLVYNYTHSPFYRREFDQAGVKPEDIRSWDDFRQLPLMDKHKQRQAQEESLERFGHPYGMLGCAPVEQFVLLSSTSGTTGTPTFYTLTAHDIEVLNRVQARKFWRIGLRPGDRLLHAFSLSMFTGGIPWIMALSNYGICVVPVGAEVGSRRVLDFADLTKPCAMACTPSFAEYLIDKTPESIGKTVRELGIHCLICAGEPGVGLPEVRRRLEEAYEAKVYDAIGAAHTFHGVSCDLPEYQGMHFLSEDYCILELRDPTTGEFLELEDGVIGEKVFTELDWHGTPLLRYALGDIFQVFTTPCDCGWPGIRFKILGRSDDMLIVKGVNVYPNAIRNVVVGFAPQTTGQMRIVLDEPGPRVKPPLKLVVEHGPEVHGEAIRRLKADLEQMLHEKLKVRPDIQMVQPGTLERATHKTKLIEVRPPAAATVTSRESSSIRSAQTQAGKGALAVNHNANSRIKEVNLVCMSGQGSVQTVELMAKAYYQQQGKYVASLVFPGSRSKSAPVVSYLKVSNRPVTATSANYAPSEVIVFWDGLLRVAEKAAHPVVQEAIVRLERGLLLVNTAQAPADLLPLSFDFEGTLATVNASEIAQRHLKRTPPPVGVTLLGALVAVNQELDLEGVLALVQERFPGAVGMANAAAAREAYAKVQVLRNVKTGPGQAYEEVSPRPPEALPEYYPLAKAIMPGFRQGSPYIWRDRIPISDDTKCLCKSTCLSEVMCPDNTGFIVREGIAGAQQGYRIDVDYCRGCGVCVEVCVYDALRMVPEAEVLRTNPTYEGITVEPHLKPAL
jgi:phenylacetate-CoA ligase